jgi:putative SOS response-associated peptidase YedK
LLKLNSTINARSETAAKSSAYREPFRRRRCIVPATGFYEPDKINYAKAPFPWHFFQFTDHRLFGIAGLYDIWTDKETGEEIRSYTILTTEPNELVGQVHDRMPVILRREDEAAWLNPDMVEPERIQAFLRPHPADEMEAWRVGDAAKNPKNDSAELIKPLN